VLAPSALQTRDALIVDTRHNNGGHTSQLIIEKLARKVIGWDPTRHYPLTSYPERAPRGSLVSIAYERHGRLELGVVFDPLKRELFVAARGGD